MLPKQMKRGEIKSKACKFHEFGRGLCVLPRSSCSLRLQGFLLSLNQALLTLLGEKQGVKQVQWGWWHHPETNYPWGSGAFVSAVKLWMVLIFHDEFPQPNEREREMRGSKKGRKPRERTQEEFFCLCSPGRSACWRSSESFSGKRSSSLPTHTSLSNQTKSQRRSSFSHSGSSYLHNDKCRLAETVAFTLVAQKWNNV